MVKNYQYYSQDTVIETVKIQNDSITTGSLLLPFHRRCSHLPLGPPSPSLTSGNYKSLLHFYSLAPCGVEYKWNLQCSTYLGLAFVTNTPPWRVIRVVPGISRLLLSLILETLDHSDPVHVPFYTYKAG